MSPTHCSAMAAISARLRVPNGWGTTAIGRSGAPSADCCARPSVTNAVEQTVREGLPRFATSTLSWTLHDVQEPQSPDPAMTTSHSAVRASSAASPAPIAELRFLWRTTFATP